MIRRAFEMKLDGKTDKEIKEYLDNAGYERTTKKGDVLKMSEKNLYKMWVDEFYYGMWIHGDMVTDLREVSPYYKPLITEEEFWILKERSNKGRRLVETYKTKDEFEALRPFDNGFLVTEEGHSFTFNLPNKTRFLKKIEGTDKKLEDVVALHQMHYSVGNKNSQYYQMSITANEVCDAVIEKLETMMVSKKDFDNYKKYCELKIKEINTEIRSKVTSRRLER